MSAILPQGGRYGDNLTDDLVQTFANMEGLNPDYVQATVGSTPPLGIVSLHFTSPQKSYVTGRPGIRTGNDDCGTQRRTNRESSSHQHSCP